MTTATMIMVIRMNTALPATAPATTITLLLLLLLLQGPVLQIGTQVSPINPGRHSTSKLSLMVEAKGKDPLKNIMPVMPLPAATIIGRIFNIND